MTQELTPGTPSPFESIRRVNATGNESWSSREFAKVLDYVNYRHFEAVITTAKTACVNSGQRVEDHFVGSDQMVEILDHMGSTELAANLFRATQAEDKLRREKITGKDKANKAHREVGAKVRKTIEELGGTMPENLPAAESIKKIETKQKRLGKQSNQSEEK